MARSGQTIFFLRATGSFSATRRAAPAASTSLVAAMDAEPVKGNGGLFHLRWTLPHDHSFHCLRRLREGKIHVPSRNAFCM